MTAQVKEAPRVHGARRGGGHSKPRGLLGSLHIPWGCMEQQKTRRLGSGLPRRGQKQGAGLRLIAGVSWALIRLVWRGLPSSAARTRPLPGSSGLVPMQRGARPLARGELDQAWLGRGLAGAMHHPGTGFHPTTVPVGYWNGCPEESRLRRARLVIFVLAPLGRGRMGSGRGPQNLTLLLETAHACAIHPHHRFSLPPPHLMIPGG